MHPRIVLMVFAFVLPSPLLAQNRPGDFRLNKIDRELITTPQFNYNGGEQKRETRERWLRIDVQFTTVPDYTDELTLKYYIAINGKVLSGEVTHVHILAGREHWSVMYVPPPALAYILQGRPPNTTSIENIAVQLVQKGEVKDELSLVRAKPQWFADFPALSGYVLDKSQTPFAPLFSDFYEQLKPAAH
ncbi:MAG TPA: Amuc_1102 family pilus-like protein [Chthoniobacterales bacterium]|nr:Amuc_1102 family pilus-like protein [Chthoniobacterales bacterium]